MGTSGLTAQAYGAGDRAEWTRMLVRAVTVAGVLGLAIWLLQIPLGQFALWMMNGNEMVRDYFYARIWAVPAGILLFGLNGWFTGMQNAVIPMCIAITVNVIHLACSFAFAFGLDLGIVGIAYASVVAQWSGVVLAGVLLLLFFRHTLVKVAWRDILDRHVLRRFSLSTVTLSYALFVS